MLQQRLVITSLVAVTRLGLTVQDYWNGLIHGRSGVRGITLFDASQMPCQIASEVPDFAPSNHMDRKTARRMPRFSQFALAAARQAIEDSGLASPMSELERVGVLIGTEVGGLDTLNAAGEILRTRGYDRIPPLFLPSGIPTVPAFLIAQEFQCLGPNNTTSTACAAGTQAVGDGAE